MKRAFLCGINYIGTDEQLNGCINDIQNINNFLVNNCGYDRKNITIMTDDPKSTIKPNKSNMEAALIALGKGCVSGDTLVFYYSGHGSTVNDRNNDESDGRDNVLVPLDYKTKGVITDDWLFKNLASLLPAGVTLWAFTDCCHSGTMLDLQYNLRCKSVCTVPNLKPQNYVSKDWSNDYAVSTERSKLTNADVYLFSGCLDPQTSADVTINGTGQGAFTSCFLEFVTSNCTKRPDGKVVFNSGTRSINDILKEITCRLIIKGFNQTPQLSFGRIQDFTRRFAL